MSLSFQHVLTRKKFISTTLFNERLYSATIANCPAIDSFRVHFFVSAGDAWLPSMPSSQIRIWFWWSSPVTHGQLFNPCVRPEDRCIYHHRDGTPVSPIRSWFLIFLCHHQWRTNARCLVKRRNSAGKARFAFDMDRMIFCYSMCINHSRWFWP